MQSVLGHGQFYGYTRARNKIPGLVLMETIYPPGLRIPNHSHEAAYFCFVLSGSYTEVCGTRTRVCGPSTLAFHPRAEVHGEKVEDSEVCSFNVGIEDSFLQRIRGYSDILDCGIQVQGGVLAALATKLYGEFRRMDRVSPLAIEGLVLELLAVASRREASKSPPVASTWLKRTADLLRVQFNQSLTLSEISEQAGVHPGHLAREFRRCFGTTVGEYVRQLRIDCARRLLRDCATPLKHVALEVGFFDQSHFCRVFRELTGMTPTEYRALVLHCSRSGVTIESPLSLESK